MPNWKKVITSGSNANLNQITASALAVGPGPYPGFLGGVIRAAVEITPPSATSFGLMITGSTADTVPLLFLGQSNLSAGEFILGKSALDQNSFQIQQTTGGGASFELYSSHSHGRSIKHCDFKDPLGGSADSYIMYSEDTASNSYFGIGTNDPSYHLHVSGTMYCDHQTIGTGTVVIDGPPGHITASGNISASGTITGNSIVGTLTGTATGLAGTPDITVGSLTATSITSSIVTSSILYTEGSNIFGDATSDTHTFNGSIIAGHITASGDISGSATSTGSFGKLSINSADPTAGIYPYVANLAGDVEIGGKLWVGDEHAAGTTFSGIEGFADDLVIDGGSSTGMTLVSTTTGKGTIGFSNYNDGDYSWIRFDANKAVTTFKVAGTEDVLQLTTTKISGSSTSTGSFGHLMVGGGTFTSASLAAGGGSGTVTQIVAGDGLNGGTITSTGTISVDSASMGGFYSASMNNFTTAGSGSFGGASATSGKTLTVEGDISASGDLYLGGGGTQAYYFGDTITAAGGLYYDHSDDNMSLNTAGPYNVSTIRLYISSSGGITMGDSVVGIGTNKPPKTLTVAGDISASGDLYLGGSTSYIKDKNGDIRMTFASAGDTIIHDESGNAFAYFDVTQGLGIGNASPPKTLTVKGDISASGKYYGGGPAVVGPTLKTLEVEGNISASGQLFLETNKNIHLSNWPGGSGIWWNSGSLYDTQLRSIVGYTYLISGSTYQHQLTTPVTGYMGIGKVNPTKMLEVAGDISASGDLLLQGGITASTDIYALGNIIGDDSTNITNISSIYLDAIHGDSDTNVQIGLGTSGINFTAEDGDKFEFNQGESNVDLRYYNSDESTMVFFDASTSKVGIGEDISETPAKTLTVKGDISASGNLILGVGGDIHLKTGNHIQWASGSGASDLSLLSPGGGLTIYSGSTGIHTLHQGGTGNVGIHTLNPPKALTVEGDISASGKYYAGRYPLVSGRPTLEVEGNISASGHLLLKPDAKVGFNSPNADDDFINYASNFDDITIKSRTIFLDCSYLGGVGIQTRNAAVYGLTVLGHISASGDLIVGNLSTTFISASTGNISASGWISASHFSGNGAGLTNVTATTSPAGSDTHVQFNDGGSTGGDAGFTYNKTTDSITLAGSGSFGGASATSGKTLTVKGDISASGDLYIGSVGGNYISGSNGNLKITGRLSANYKSFDIPHPTKPNKRLVYGSLEGPEYGVYIRGKLENENIIYLPEYWTELVDENTITVQLTPIENYQKLYVKKIKSNKVYIGKSGFKNINCYYNVYAERKDEKIEVEVEE